ncbi:uncharacterized protein haspin isoform X1 [Thunnus maccoyii]|uniref:uncharacterized protein haspin isoform X1 n=2 Tax=Thunnus maccoyii TaxID=8240 RepID=UPI001C4D565A|nr:uncharacterized protein haspin isoform X1 [Thunnus maccoyii]
MDPGKPLYLKTYGRQKRRVSAWILPDKRKQAFDSTGSSEGDISVFEPVKPTTKRGSKTSVASRRAMRPAKKNAMVCLTEKSYDEENMSDEENVIPSPPCPQPTKESKKTRVRKTSVASHRAMRPAKRNAIVCLSEKSYNEENISDEENVFISSHPCPQSAKQSKKTSGKADRPTKRKTKCLTENCGDEENIDLPPLSRRQPAQQSKTTRKSKLVSATGALMRRKRQHDPITSESEEDSRSSAKSHKTGNLPSTGRFVTRRRRAVSTKSKLPKATVSVLNSSDDFHTSRILRPSRRRRVPLSFLVSSVENSVNAAGTSSSATNPFREISLNESADHSLGPGSRKPIFCSTPSASSFSKRPYIKPSPINDQSSPPSMSVSCIGLVSTFQEDQDSPGQPHTAPPIKQSSLGEKQLGPHYNEEPSGESFLQLKNMNKTSSCSEVARSPGEDSNTKNSGTLQSLNLLTTDSESSSHFVSAAGGLEWLIEALKENCLTWRCTVQLERLDNFTVTQLYSETTYSSCLEHSSSVHSQPTNEHSLSVDSSHTIDPPSSSKPPICLCSSVTNNATSDSLQSTNNSFEPSVTDSQSTNLSLSVDYKQSAERSSAVESMEQSTSLLNVESTHCIDSSVDFVMGTQLSADSPVQTVAAKNKCLNKKCKAQLKALTLSRQTVRQLKGFREASLACDDKSVNPDANKSENDHTYNIEDSEDLARSREIVERMMVVRQSTNSAVTQPESNDPETLKTMLKEKCLNDKFIVEINRLTLSQLKENLQCKGTKLKSPTDVSDSASDNQTKSDHQSESDTNRCKGSTSSVNVNKKKRGSTSSGNNISSDRDVVKKSCDVLPKRRKTSLALREKKRRSTSTDRPGTTRKACVSGLSVSRWKTKNSASTHTFKSRTAQRGGTKTVDCSINELISTQSKQQQELFGTTMNFSTPARASRLNFSSLLADLTPNTHTWSRLKAALSVHRKNMVLLTPRSLHTSVPCTPGRAELADVSQDLFATPLRTPLSRRLQSQLMSCNSLVACEDADLSDAEKVYAECDQQGPLPWEECILPQRMKQCVKIGEGTFGEVFSTTNASGDTVALKIIPLEGSEKVNGEDQKTFGEILHEIIISKELSSLKEKQQNQTHGFIGLNDLHCVRGCYPPDFLKAWDTFDQQKGSENDRPDFFQQDQLFIILEFEFGGTDLENSNGTLASLGVAKSILHQVTAALAVAEEELKFEHRDLHWGNVLVKTTKQKKGSFVLNGTAHSVETKGVLVRIIDYSLSRLEIDDLTVSCDISKDEELFMGQGDYQFDIYRLMRQENGNNWSNYHPHTNVLWLHYLCSKLLSMKYRGTGGRAAKDIREELTRFYDNVLQYSSATEALQSCPMFQ